MSMEGDRAIVIREAVLPNERGEVAALFEEYAASLGIDLGFQDFAAEVAHLDAHYAPPQGALYVAEREGTLLGCVALRAFAAPDIAELKRLYVRPAGRGHALGRRLSQIAISRAAALGYTQLRLDTLPSMLAAQALYAGLGFREIAPYRFNPIAGTRYLELMLSPTA
ncbi:Acetyltransferase (GNAT) family protein [Pseudoxanthomonas sp. GM95]|uniref:GNAT family N-acetyltransferase n=1 Tax=Pseudoxanthomonas sp. GM95 TaxID=1881043 RepID=UPI0008D141E4|nr:GNAT family N-acetyltransferase [Pseudoxanthomonas sp. GM95]SEL46260.1 Acetyltransferase (GNAT) family protein [Pseudoxanthomonas sp. GM95]